MTIFTKALTEQLQLWLGESTAITEQDVIALVQAATADSFKTVNDIILRVEGHPQDVSQVSVILKSLLPLSDQKTQRFMLPNGNISRKLVIEAPPPPEPQAKPGNLSGKLVEPTLPPATRTRVLTPQDTLYDALTTLAQGVLAFPADDEGRRQFNSAYPPRFTEGVGKLSAYFLTKGLHISDPLEYWRLLSRPLKEWPHMPPGLQSPDALITHDGFPTNLTKHLAKQVKDSS